MICRYLLEYCSNVVISDTVAPLNKKWSQANVMLMELSTDCCVPSVPSCSTGVLGFSMCKYPTAQQQLILKM